ncbi:MAG: lysylphosphatidylglycerol synthase transmembrane domain-containing protein [Aggregatilineales bacterium]
MGLDETAENGRQRGKQWRYVNIGMAVVLLGLVLYEVGLGSVKEALKGVNLELLALCLLLSPIAPLLSAVKWRLLIRSQGYPISLVAAFRLYLVGMFVNNFMPSNIGGDVVRIHELGLVIGSRATAAASVFTDRLTGFIVLLILAGIAFFARFTALTSLPLPLILLLAASGVALIMWLALDARPLRIVQKHIQLGLVQQLAAKFSRFQTALLGYRDRPRVLAGAFFLSVLFYAQVSIFIWLLTFSIEPEAALIDIAFVVPITLIFAAVPLSINGIGWQEWSYALLYPTSGLSASVGVATMLLLRAVTWLLVLLGGIFYLRQKLSRPAEVDTAPAFYDVW